VADLNVLVPSRGRPDAARELVDAFAETCTAETVLTFVIDEDDPVKDQYSPLVSRGPGAPPYPAVEICYVDNTAHTMVYALNGAAAAEAARGEWAPFAIGFCGDDHRPRTKGWDTEYLDALRELGTGIVFAEDGYQGEKLPTQCAMTADIIRALGWMAPPALRHMYVDNFWLDLGSQADCLTYLPDVLVEHMHPVTGKVEWSEGHERVNAPEVVDADAASYAAYAGQSLAGAVAAVKALTATEHAWRLFEAGTVPEYTQPEWYAGRDRAPHLEQAGHRERLTLTARLINEHVVGTDLATLSDLGAGDGGLLSLLDPSIRAWGYDLQQSNLDGAAERGVDVRYGDVVTGDIDWGDIVVATEMLEHLVDPHGLVCRIRANARVLVCSSPWHERAGGAYEFHTWAFDPVGYRALVRKAGFEVLRHEFSGPFQIILAVRP
jgi:hypothetical protein